MTMNGIVALCLAFFLCDLTVTSSVPDGSLPLNDELAEIRRYVAEMKKNYDRLQLKSELRISKLEKTVEMLAEGQRNTTEELEERVEVLEEGVEVLEERVEVLEVTVALLEEDINRVDEDIDSLQIETGVLTINLEELEARVIAEENITSLHTFQISELQTDYSDLETRLGDVEETQNAEGNYSFLVTFSVNAVNVADGETLVFDEVRINEGNHYDPTTGIYTAPVDGLYTLTAHSLPNAQLRGGCWLVVDGARVGEAYRREDTEEDTATELSLAVVLTAGQAVSVQNYASTSMHGISEGTGKMFSWFTAYLVKVF